MALLRIVVQSPQKYLLSTTTTTATLSSMIFCRQYVQFVGSKHTNTLVGNIVGIHSRLHPLQMQTIVYNGRQSLLYRTFFTGRRRLTRMSPLSLAFVIGFTTMGTLMIAESLLDTYHRKGLVFSDLFALFRSSSSDLPTVVNTVDSDDNRKIFATNKYASLLSASETPINKLRISRVIPGVVPLSNMKLTLLQYQTCPFCCKVRAFLDYYGLPYEVVEVNPVMRQQLKFSKSYRKVPILLISPINNNSDNNEQHATTSDNNTDTLQINDSTLIISALTSYLLSLKPTSRHHNETLTTITRWYLNSSTVSEDEELNESHKRMTTFTARKAAADLVNRYFLMIGDVDPAKYERMDPPLAQERRWRRWVDDHLVHVLSPNIYQTYEQALQSFRYFSDVGEWEKNFSPLERNTVIYVGALAMYFVSKRLKKKYRLKEDVRESLYDSVNYWLKSIGNQRKFMGGDEPNLADLSVYGALSSIEGCEAFRDLMQHTKLSRWYTDVKLQVEQHQGSNRIKFLFNY